MTVCPPLLYLLSMALTACRTATPTPTRYSSFLSWFGPKHEGTLDGLGQDKPLSVILLREHGSIAIAVVHGRTIFGADPAD